MVDLARQHVELRPQIDAAIAEVIDSGRFIMGPQLLGFESEFAAASQSAYAIGVSSGTDALLVSLMALGIGAGDEVITSAFTFFATAGVIARLGATPVFCDINPDTFTLDPQAASDATTPQTKAILPVHLYGRLATLPPTALPVVEDAAQSIGTGAPKGIASCFSFFPTKNVGALGDAGAVVTNDKNFADTVRLLRTHGGRPKYFHSTIGGNFRMDALQAAILRVKLQMLDTWTQKRRANAEGYRERFASQTAGLPIALPQPSPEHVYHQFTIRVPDRDALRSHLQSKGIATEIYYPHPLHLQACFSHLGYKEGSLPHTELAARESLSIPIHPQLEEADLQWVVSAIKEFFVGVKIAAS